jgi:plastocyanin
VEEVAKNSSRTLEDAMSNRPKPLLALALAIAAVLSLAACGTSTSTGTAGVSSPVPVASAPEASSGAGSGSGDCTASTAAGTVQAGMAGTAFVPATIQAKVGDVIAWTNNDTVAHTATLKDDPACTTETLAPGATGSLTFSAAGTFAFFCKVHPAIMSGTIEVTD